MAKFDENYFNAAEEPFTLESLLTDGEQLLWKGKPKKSAYILNSILRMLPIALIWLLIDGAMIGCMIGFGIFKELPPWAVVIIVIFLLFHLFPVWLWINNIITANRQHKHLEYIFTNQRIIIKSGIIGININNIYYSDIENINLRIGIIDKMLKVGDIYITSKNKAQVLWDIEDSINITNKLQKIISDIKADIAYPNALRPSENSGYNTKYTQGDTNE